MVLKDVSTIAWTRKIFSVGVRHKRTIAAVEAAENNPPVVHMKRKQNDFKAIKESKCIIDSRITQELKECKTNLDESSRALGEATSSRDSSLIALQTKQTELEKYTALNDLTSDYKILQTKLNETLGLLARKDIDIQEGLKTKTYEISVVNQKHDELVKKSLLTRSQFEGQLKEKSKVISDLKVKEGKDIDTMIEMDKQIKFLNEILYKRNQSIQTIHMLAPKCATYNGRSTFANPKYLKKAQSEKPRLYEIPYDTSDPANRFCPNGEETVTLEKESRSKLDKDKVKPYDYTYQNSLYETFKPPSKTYLDQLERAKEVRKTMWRKTFVRTKPNIAKNLAFLPISKSISKSRQLYNEMTNNFNHFRTICQQTWSNHTNSAFPNPTAKSMEVLIKTLLMPLSNKTILDSHCFVHELKKEMNDDLEYVKSLEKEIDELESEKADFSNMYDLLLEECVSKDVTCSYLHSLSDLNANTELQCLYLHKVKECECLAQKLSKQTESVNKEVHNNLLKSFSKLEKHSISLELALQQCKEQMKNNSVCKENGSNVFRKEREQYHEIQDLKGSNARQAQIAIKTRAQWFTKDEIFNERLKHSSSKPSSSCQQVSAENNTSGPALVLHQITSNHNRSELRIQDHSNEQSSLKLVSKSCSSSSQDSFITTRAGITILPSYSDAKDNSHKVVRLGINPMIQPEPEDLPKDNPKLEIAVLRQRMGNSNLNPIKISIYEDILSRNLKFKDKELPQTQN
ncbi:hypothetical protein Tco_1405808 [Tanacetum coccineum]